MTVDKARVMKLAWHWAKQDLWSHRADKSLLREYFVQNLKKAWADQKRIAAIPPVVTSRTKEEVLDAIRAFESKDTIRGNDWKVLDELRRELVYAK